MLNVACVKWGEAYGPEYVNILADMVARSLRRDFKFICFTDDPEGIGPAVEARPLPPDLHGWWTKLYLFKPGHFDDRVLYFDLDTVILGGLEELAEYDGDFAILEDFYRKEGYGSGVMAWRPDFGAHIWERYVEAGYPKMAGGDQTWIERCVKDVDFLQTLYPQRFRSYKADCQDDIPAGTWVVCFHGQPKPHNCGHAQIEQVWRIGGSKEVENLSRCNTPLEVLSAQVRENCKRAVGRIEPSSHSGHMVIVGGGPSLKETWRGVRARQKRGQKVWAINAVHDWLIERKVVPDFHIMHDARPENAQFVKHPREDVTYYIASQCHPSVFHTLEGYNVVMWHVLMDGMEEVVNAAEPLGMDPCLIGGGGSTGTRAMYLGYILGYRAFHFYGLDSCYRDGENHAYRQPLNDREKIQFVTVRGRTFHCARWMADQAQKWQRGWAELDKRGCHVTVHGDGLIPFIYRTTLEDLKERSAA